VLTNWNTNCPLEHLPNLLLVHRDLLGCLAKPQPDISCENCVYTNHNLLARLAFPAKLSVELPPRVWSEFFILIDLPGAGRYLSSLNKRQGEAYVLWSVYSLDDSLISHLSQVIVLTSIRLQPSAMFLPDRLSSIESLLMPRLFLAHDLY
jgi:hypothetical protein